jgi:ankyrin repeat protein
MQPSILLIYDPKSPVARAEWLYDYLLDGGESTNLYSRGRMTLFFAFNALDCRNNSVEAMLYTFLTQLACPPSPGYAEVCGAALKSLEALDSAFVPRLEDLFAIFHDILLQFLCDFRFPSMTLVLGGVDQTTERIGWLLGKLLAITTNSELPFKVAITTADSELFSRHASSVSTLDLTQDLEGEMVGSTDESTSKEEAQDAVGTSETATNEGQADSSSDRVNGQVLKIPQPSQNLGFDLLELLQERTDLYGLTTLAHDLLQSCSSDADLREMVIFWLRELGRSKSPTELQEILSSLTPGSPEEVFHSILSSMPFALQTQALAILDWVLHALRPLTISEIEDGGLFEISNSPFRQATRQLKQVSRTELTLQGLLAVRRNELHFGHPRLREFLLSRGGADPSQRFKVKDEAETHKVIADACLAYLSSPRNQDKMMALASLTGVARNERREDFLSYAIRYWPRHAKLAEPGGNYASQQSRAFFADEKTTSLWARAYASLMDLMGSTPELLQQSDQVLDPTKSLAILAEHQLEALLVEIIDKYKESVSSYDACISALIAAARSGNTNIVRMLINLPLLNRPLGPVDSEAVQNAVLAGIESCDSTIMTELIRWGLTSPRNLQHPIIAFGRAVSLGQTAAANLLVAATKTDLLASDTESRHMVTLRFAYERGFIESANLLSTSQIEQPLTYEAALQLACQYGHLELANILAEEEITRNIDTQEQVPGIFLGCLSTARYYRQHRALQTVLDCIRSHSIEPFVGGTPAFIVVALEGGQLECARVVLTDFLRSSVRIPGGEYDDLLAAAIRTGDEGIRDVLLKRESIVDRVDEPVFSTALRAALYTGDRNILGSVYEIYLQFKGTTTPEETLNGLLDSALALDQDKLDSLRFLIAKGVDITSRTQNQRTPLFHAAYCGHVAVCEALIDSKVDVNVSGDGDWYPVHAAYDNAEITKLLVQAGANFDVKTESDLTALYLAAKWDYPDVIREMLKAKLSQETVGSALMVAIRQGNARIVQILLDAFPDYVIDFSPAEGESREYLLNQVFRHGSEALLKTILSYNIDVNAQDSDGETALHGIHKVTKVSMVRMLLNRGANVNIMSSRNQTPLYIAIYRGNEEVAKYLVSRGAKINLTGAYHGGPLHQACNSGSLDLIKFLVDNKADVNLVDPGLMATPLAAAFQGDENPEKDQIIEYLVKEVKADVNLGNAWWGNVLNVACLTSNVEMVDMIIDHGADTDMEDSLGRRPIHFALYRTLEHVMLMGKHKGGNLDGIDKMERHALHFAVVSGRLNLVQYVIEQRKDLVNVTDIHGWTALLWALRICGRWETQTTQRYHIIEALLEAGSKRLVTGEGRDRLWTPVKLAKYYSLSDEIVQLLAPTPEELETDEGKLFDRSFGGRKAIGEEKSVSYCDACLMVSICFLLSYLIEVRS